MDTFIYEYVGDVVSQPSFLKRMRTYAEEGIRHFYFMMLQKDEVRRTVSQQPHYPRRLYPVPVFNCKVILSYSHVRVGVGLLFLVH